MNSAMSYKTALTLGQQAIRKKGKVLVVSEGNGNWSSSYYRPFREFGDEVCDSNLLWKNPDSINLIVFTGGADVTPALYGQESAPRTGTVPRRDIYESVVFYRAKQLQKPMVGICRGSQFLNVMAGGRLCQHLDGHTVHRHQITTCDGEKFDVSSTHHQMMLPPIDAKIIGWSSQKKSSFYYGESDKVIQSPKEYEVVYWPNIRAIGMQYHPEIMSDNDRAFVYASEIVKNYLKV